MEAEFALAVRVGLHDHTTLGVEDAGRDHVRNVELVDLAAKALAGRRVIPVVSPIVPGTHPIRSPFSIR
jgi:hypothetical protein